MNCKEGMTLSEPPKKNVCSESIAPVTNEEKSVYSVETILKLARMGPSLVSDG